MSQEVQVARKTGILILQAHETDSVQHLNEL